MYVGHVAHSAVKIMDILCYIAKHSAPRIKSIIESVDSISRDGPDTPIYIIHYKK